jgi:exosortase
MRHLYFIIYILLLVGLFFVPLKALTELSFDSELYSHFLLIPVVSLYFFITDRKTIFAKNSYSFRTGISLIAAGLLLYWLGKTSLVGLNQNDYLALMMFSFFLCINGGFIGLYGSQTFRKALFPLLFLIFIIPIPTVILDPFIRILQVGSAHLTYVIFKVIGIPVFRDGMVFELPGIAIEVAKECSGIRSSLALTITSLIAGYLFLQTGLKRIILVLAIFPLMIVKNAIRITTITLLAVYVDKSFLTGSFLHSSGGIFFFLIALALLAPVLLFLKKTEKSEGPPNNGNLDEENIGIPKS